MNDDAQRHLNTYIAIAQFGADNSGDFSPGSPGDINFTAMTALVNSQQSAGSEQAGAFNELSQQVEIKGTRREAMRSQMKAISDMAEGMEYEFDGIRDLFRMPRNRTDTDLLSAARAFAVNAVDYFDDFKTYGLPGSFITDLTAAADDFDASLSAVAGKRAERSETTADVQDWVTQGMRIRRILDPIVRYKYRNDKGKLAAWETARHIERPSKKKTPPTP